MWDVVGDGDGGGEGGGGDEGGGEGSDGVEDVVLKDVVAIRMVMVVKVMVKVEVKVVVKVVVVSQHLPLWRPSTASRLNGSGGTHHPSPTATLSPRRQCCCSLPSIPGSLTTPSLPYGLPLSSDGDDERSGRGRVIGIFLIAVLTVTIITITAMENIVITNSTLILTIMGSIVMTNDSILINIIVAVAASS